MPSEINGPVASREEILQKAADFARKHGLEPRYNYYTAASFVVDTKAKAFIETNHQNKQRAVYIARCGYYQPYTWQVRHFIPVTAHALQGPIYDTFLSFTPQGAPYGFVQKIYNYTRSDQEKILPQQEAQKVAELQASRMLDIDFARYTLVSVIPAATSLGLQDSNIQTVDNYLLTSLESQESHTQTVADYLFIYHRKDAHIDSGSYGLALAILGTKLIELKHFISMPGYFMHSYQKLEHQRKLLVGIGILSSVIYFLGSCLGLFFLRSTGWIIWRPGIYWALLLTLLSLADTLNTSASAWMNYSIFSLHRNILFYSIISLIGALLSFFGKTVIIVAAETFTRKAFGHHVQLWKTWSSTVASSFEVLKSTIAGYILVPFDLVYVLVFYLIVNYFGWWISSDPLTEPEFASYSPLFSIISTSINAGFIEECFLRAIPLAGAALIGDRFGKRRLFISIAFILQALVFGMLHASYLASPAYVRLVELMVTSFILGAAYLIFGLYTAIITHITFDLVVFSSSDFGSGWRIFIIFCVALIPMIVVLYRRLHAKQWKRLAPDAYNLAWQKNF